MSDRFTFEVFRNEWVAQVGSIDDRGTPSSFKPSWTSPPFPTRKQAVVALEAHEDVIGYNDRLMRYEMRKSYTHGQVTFRKTKVDEYDR